MVFIGFIMKVILGILLALIILVAVSLVIILFFPISYDIEGEKYAQIKAQVIAKIFYVLGIHYRYTEDNSFVRIQLLGKTIKEISLSQKDESNQSIQSIKIEEEKASEQKSQEQEENDKQKQDETQQSAEAKIITRSIEVEKKETSEPIGEQNESKASSKAKTKSKSKDTTAEEPTKSKKSIKQRLREIYNLVKKLWTDPNRGAFFAAAFKMIKEIIKRISPKILWFDILIGRENPADTGELIAKLSVAYPLYASYGNIQGVYDEEGYWGEVRVQGKFNIYQLLKPIAVFGLNKEVRGYIKTILSVRKD